MESCVTGGGESFTAGTKVLLATGVAVPIASLKPGDKVLATNTSTGKTSAETVTAVLLHHDTDRYDLTIRAGHRTAVIDTTRNHLFWDLTGHRWIKADALKYGDHLRGPNGASVTVVAGWTPANPVGWMWDLSVPGGNDHDFYIDTVVGSVLVHNCGPEFREDTSHIFRDAPGHLPEDTAENRALLQDAVNPENFAGTRGPGGSISVYRQLLPDGRQVWVEVRNGVEITNGGINEIPRF